MLTKLFKEFKQFGEIQQSEDELAQLIEEIGDRKFGTMCEIGVADGGTLWLYSQLFGKQDGKFIVTDMDIRPTAKRVMKAIWAKMGIQFEIYECQNTQFKLKEPVEFLHIDGAHDYKSVNYDYCVNSHMVEFGGIIILHDTEIMPGPKKLRKELEKTMRTKTFIGKKGYGTTVVYK